MFIKEKAEAEQILKDLKEMRQNLKNIDSHTELKMVGEAATRIADLLGSMSKYVMVHAKDMIMGPSRPHEAPSKPEVQSQVDDLQIKELDHVIDDLGQALDNEVPEPEADAGDEPEILDV
jgi:hypothetical protein